jgi:hypothetical protein
MVFTCVVLKCKKTLPLVMAFSGAWRERYFILDQCCKSTTPFPTSHWPHPFQKPTPFTPTFN